MIIKFDFEIGLDEYESKGKQNEFPVFERCPNCNCISHGNLHRNGYYWRYGIDEKSELLIPICRLRCKACGVNISILDRKSTRLNSSHVAISYAVFCLKKERK